MENELFLGLIATSASISALGIMVYSTFIRKPPMNWFEGAEDNLGSLNTVGPNEKFTNMWFGRIGRYYDDFRHLSGNNATL